jgi:hypothetical protein
MESRAVLRGILDDRWSGASVRGLMWLNRAFKPRLSGLLGLIFGVSQLSP